MINLIRYFSVVAALAVLTTQASAAQSRYVQPLLQPLKWEKVDARIKAPENWSTQRYITVSVGGKNVPVCQGKYYRIGFVDSAVGEPIRCTSRNADRSPADIQLLRQTTLASSPNGHVWRSLANSSIYRNLNKFPTRAVATSLDLATDRRILSGVCTAKIGNQQVPGNMILRVINQPEPSAWRKGRYTKLARYIEEYREPRRAPKCRVKLLGKWRYMDVHRLLIHKQPIPVESDWYRVNSASTSGGQLPINALRYSHFVKTKIENGRNTGESSILCRATAGLKAPGQVAYVGKSGKAYCRTIQLDTADNAAENGRMGVETNFEIFIENKMKYRWSPVWGDVGDSYPAVAISTSSKYTPCRYSPNNGFRSDITVDGKATQPYDGSKWDYQVGAMGRGLIPLTERSEAQCLFENFWSTKWNRNPVNRNRQKPALRGYDYRYSEILIPVNFGSN